MRFDLANEVTTPIDRLPMPTIQTHLDGPLKERLTKLFEKLQADYPAPRPIEPITASTESQWTKVKVILKIPTNEQATAVYVHSEGIIAFGPTATHLLDHRHISGRLAGTRYAIHEWFHAMRIDRNRIYPLEEGGAELFADRVTRLLTGVDGSLRRIQTYAGFARGVTLLGEAVEGPNRALYWALESRRATDLRAWFTAEMEKIGMQVDDIQALMDYDIDSSGNWYTLVDRALRRRQ